MHIFCFLFFCSLFRLKQTFSWSWSLRQTNNLLEAFTRQSLDSFHWLTGFIIDSKHSVIRTDWLFRVVIHGKWLSTRSLEITNSILLNSRSGFFWKPLTHSKGSFMQSILTRNDPNWQPTRNVYSLSSVCLFQAVNHFPKVVNSDIIYWVGILSFSH